VPRGPFLIRVIDLIVSTSSDFNCTHPSAFCSESSNGSSGLSPVLSSPPEALTTLAFSAARPLPHSILFTYQTPSACFSFRYLGSSGCYTNSDERRLIRDVLIFSLLVCLLFRFQGLLPLMYLNLVLNDGAPFIDLAC
jgi:hypothetical protein